MCVCVCVCVCVRVCAGGEGGGWASDKTVPVESIDIAAVESNYQMRKT